MSDKINREYKDRLFKRIFGTKEDLLSLYNAINGTEYNEPNDIEINNIEDFVYMSMKNDASFLLYDILNLYEHQSTKNPNIPLRGFLYFAELYKALFENHKDLYSSKIISLPTPQFIVFYNGRDDEPDEKYLSMSDAFIGRISGEPALECKARFININAGHNDAIMQKCKRLQEYSILIKKIREYIDIGMSNSNAINKAVDECIEEGILAEILLKHKMEVTDMLLAEYDEQLHIDNEKGISFQEGLAQGKLEGVAQGKSDELKFLVKEGIIDADFAAKRLGMTVKEFKDLMDNVR